MSLWLLSGKDLQSLGKAEEIITSVKWSLNYLLLLSLLKLLITKLIDWNNH